MVKMQLKVQDKECVNNYKTNNRIILKQFNRSKSITIMIPSSIILIMPNMMNKSINSINTKSAIILGIVIKF